MGKFVDTLILFNKSRRAKIATWSLIAFGALFSLIGIMFVLINPSVAKPSELTLVASSNMPFETRDGKTGYHLQITDITTSIITSADISNTPVRFSTAQHNLIEVTPAVMPGQTAVIKLKSDQYNKYFLSGEVTIHVSCGSINTVIYAEIVLTQQNTEIIATLQKEVSPNVWEDTTVVRPDIFNNTSYRVNAVFVALGQVCLESTSPTQQIYFNFTPLDIESDVTEIFGDLQHTLINPINDTYMFDLWVYFQGSIYHSLAPFSITFTTEA